jgi:hypothetical protein
LTGSPVVTACKSIAPRIDDYPNRGFVFHFAFFTPKQPTGRARCSYRVGGTALRCGHGYYHSSKRRGLLLGHDGGSIVVAHCCSAVMPRVERRGALDHARASRPARDGLRASWKLSSFATRTPRQRAESCST